jgi:hypothetical protein
MRKRKNNMFISLIILLLSIGLGYALLTQDLTINGITKVKGNNWDIHFNNVQVSSGSVALSTGDSAASIDLNDNTLVNYTVTLNQPGDYYEFTVDAVNAGTVDGMVESVTSKLNNEPITTLPSYLKYSVTYETNDEIQINHLLKAGDSEKYKVRIEYKRDINNTDMPTTAQTLSLSFRVVYVQADSNGVEVEHPLNGIIYTVNHLNIGSIHLNQQYPSTIPYFETSSEALSTIAIDNDTATTEI